MYILFARVVTGGSGNQNDTDSAGNTRDVPAIGPIFVSTHKIGIYTVDRHGAQTVTSPSVSFKNIQVDDTRTHTFCHAIDV